MYFFRKHIHEAERILNMVFSYFGLSSRARGLYYMYSFRNTRGRLDKQQ